MYNIDDYKLNNVENLDTPALLIYPKYIQQNLQAIHALVGNMNHLRPHVKTDKIPEIISMMLDAGINKFKCATIAEAEMLAITGAKDVLLAYQPSEAKALRLKELSKAYPDVQFSCIVDNRETVTMLASVFQYIEVYIDVNVGMNRTGIMPENVPALGKKISQCNALKLKGLHIYDGHIEDADVEVRTDRASTVFKQVLQLKIFLEEICTCPLDMIMAGSPTFAIYHLLSQQSNVSVQLSPGTFTLWDAGYKNILPELPFRCAAVLLSTVVSIINHELLCIDLGYKAMASENPLQQRVILLNMPGAIPFSQSEEHLVVKVPDTSAYSIGQLIYGIPWHVCPTVALYERIEVVEEGRISGSWDVIARKRKINY